MPPADRGSIAARETWYRAHWDKVDTLLLGTSRLQYGVDAAEFDSAMAEFGCPTHSLNLSLAGLNIRELLHFARMIRDDPPPRLRYLLVEPRPNQSRPLEALLAPRYQATLTVDTFVLSVREVLINPASRNLAWSRLGDYLLAFAYRNLGLGVMVEHLLGRAPRGRTRAKEQLLALPEYRPLGLQRDGGIEFHDVKFRRPAQQERWRADIARYPSRAEKAKLHKGWPYLVHSYMQILQAVPGELVFVLPPASHPQSAALRRLLQELHPDRPAIYLDPVAEPDLYDANLWYDRGHLNATGATKFSRLLAASVCRPDHGALAGSDPVATGSPR